MPKRLPLAERQDALRLILAGAKDDEIAAEIGCSSRTVARIRARGTVTDRTTKGRVYRVRVSQREAEAFEQVLAEQGITASEALRRMMRMSADIVDLRSDELAALRESGNQLNALARNLVQMLQLARAGRLQWNARDSRLVEDLATRTEAVARAMQVFRAAGGRRAFTSIGSLPEADDG